MRAIGLKPRKGKSFIGDIGFITSDNDGMINTARIYWSNKKTNLVNDLPSEAWLYPKSWGRLSFK